MDKLEKHRKIYLEKKCPGDPWIKEALALCEYTIDLNHGAEIGVGSRKTHPKNIGIDIVPGSEVTNCCSGDNLSCFTNNELDYIVANHNIEHYLDPVKTLMEWGRVVKNGGIIAFTCPDCRNPKIKTFNLNKEHKYITTPTIMKELVSLALPKVELISESKPIEGWSFCLVYRNIK